MTIDELFNKIEINKTTRVIDESLIKSCEEKVGVPFGLELREYILKYGYLAYKYVELYGINSNQGIKSDLITQTEYLHKYYPVTNELIVIENQGEGDYYLVDMNDKMFEYDTHLDEVIALDISLNEYIVRRFANLN